MSFLFFFADAFQLKNFSTSPSCIDRATVKLRACGKRATYGSAVRSFGKHFFEETCYISHIERRWKLPFGPIESAPKLL
jgi:hypothetical protein